MVSKLAFVCAVLWIAAAQAAEMKPATRKVASTGDVQVQALEGSVTVIFSGEAAKTIYEGLGDKKQKTGPKSVSSISCLSPQSCITAMSPDGSFRNLEGN